MRIINGSSNLSINENAGAAIEELTLSGKEIIKKLPHAHFQSSFLFPFPNRLKGGQFTFEGKTYQFEQNDFGRPNALHGIVHDLPVKLTKVAANQVSVVLVYDHYLESFPFAFELSVNYTLAEKSLLITNTLKNTGALSFPCGFGWHPYFYVGSYEGVKMKLPSKRLVSVDEQMIPTGVLTADSSFDQLGSIEGKKLDTCFLLDEFKENISSFISYADGQKLEVWQDDQFRYLQVYTPDDESSIAIEPMTCNIDALNNGDGLKVLEPGNDWELTCGLRLHDKCI
jgi:aldose 1-epimerase